MEQYVTRTSLYKETFLWYGTSCLENDEFNDSSIAACFFNSAATHVLRRCLATIRDYEYRQTDVKKSKGIMQARELLMEALFCLYSDPKLYTE